MATEYNIPAGNLFAGADHSLIFNVVDSAGDPQTMTGWALKFVLRRTYDNALVFSATTGGSDITIGNGAGANTRATVAVADPDTLGQPAGWRYKYSLWRTDDGSDTVLSYGLAFMTEAAAQ